MPKAVFNNREAWLAGRKTRIGASEAAAALGLSPYCSRFKLSKLKRGEIKDDFDLGELGEWGLRHEPTIAQAVRDRTGRDVRLLEPFSMFVHDSIDFLSAPPDAFMRRGPNDKHLPSGVGVLQIKTANEFVRKEWENGPPDHHIVQLQQEMDVTGATWGSLVVLIGGNKLRGPFDFTISDDWLAEAQEQLIEFWRRYVLGDEEPPVDSSEATAKAIAALYTDDNRRVIRLDDPEFILACDELVAARLAIKQAEDREQLAKNKIALAMQDNAVALLPDGRQVTYKTVERGGYIAKPTSFRQIKVLN